MTNTMSTVINCEVATLGHGKSDLQTSTLLPDISDECWVVLLSDPDEMGWSAWSALAEDYESAVASATAQWWGWIAEGTHSESDCSCDRCNRENYDAPEVIKVYRRSWIGERVDRNKG